MENRVNTDGQRAARPGRGHSRHRARAPAAPHTRKRLPAQHAHGGLKTRARPPRGRRRGANAPMPGQPVGAIPYQRTRPHITQEPIADDPTRYVTRERYATLEQTRPRRHMGVATSDPQYLPVTEPGRGAQPGANGDVPGAGAPPPRASGRRSTTTVISRRPNQARRSSRRATSARGGAPAPLSSRCCSLPIAIALVWLFVLR